MDLGGKKNRTGVELMNGAGRGFCGDVNEPSVAIRC